MGYIKNLIGEILGYESCPITGDTFWMADKYVVSYSNMEAVYVSEKAFKKFPKEKIAIAVYNKGQRSGCKGIYSLEQIIEDVESISRNL